MSQSSAANLRTVLGAQAVPQPTEPLPWRAGRECQEALLQQRQRVHRDGNLSPEPSLCNDDREPVKPSEE